MTKNKYIITIQRQFGSLGRPIAMKMSELLGIEFYDRDIVDEAAKKLNLPASIIREEEEKSKVMTAPAPKNPFVRMAYPLGKGATDTQDKIFEAQQNIIQFLADRESCIIVGRCSDFILSDYPNVMNVYIYAPYQVRVQNSVKNLNLTLEEARRTIASVDKAREQYHMHYAGYLPDDKNYKDVLIDSSFLGVDGTAEFLADAARRRFRL